MSNKDYYALWLKFKEQFENALAEDQRIQEFAINKVGLKPQATAVELVARVYSRYCELYNKICDYYDQMHQVQRRPYIKTIIDALTCRIIELKETLEEVEVFEFTYADNAFQQLLIKPHDIQILCPFYYPFEIRQAEMQYVMDQIFAGNRIGDPTPTPSQEELLKEAKREEEQRIQEEKEAEIMRKLALGIEIHETVSIELTPSEIEDKRLQEEYERHIFNIQRMERSRYVTKEKIHAKLKDENLYLELAGLKKPPAEETLRNKAAEMVKSLLQKYMKLKREHFRENKLKEKLGMTIPAYRPPSAKEQLENVKEARRNFRRAYYEKWLADNVKEKSRVLKLREGDIMEDISDEIRQWYTEWINRVHMTDEFPFADEGGSLLIVKGETFTIPEYLDWKETEEKRIKAEAGAQKSKEQIKAEKKAAKEEKKRLAQEAREREKKRLIEYKKSRLNPDNDPGVYIEIGKNFDDLKFAWTDYECQWKAIDEPEAGLDAIRGHIMHLITENAYKDINIELRPIVDEAMRIELEILRNALKLDYQSFDAKLPLTKKRKKPRKIKPPKPEKIPPKAMFQSLADEGIVRSYPRITLEEFWGDRNYAAADCRSVLWTPTFPPPCIGDVKEQIRIRCMLSLGANCSDLRRSQLLVGPKGSGKRTIVHAIATETNALLIDISPLTVYNKFPGPKLTKTMWLYIYKISRMMQPTIIFVDNADKLFYKKVPKEEKMFDPTRLSNDFFKEIIKPIGRYDKIMVIGTASEPWLAKSAKMFKVFPDTIMMPRSDYGSISFILTHTLMKLHGVNREFDVHCVAQVLRGYSIHTIKKAIYKLVSGKRLAELTFNPLKPMEILETVLKDESAIFTDSFDTEMFNTWYLSYSPWGQKYIDYMIMLECQYAFKLKADKKKKG